MNVTGTDWRTGYQSTFKTESSLMGKAVRKRYCAERTQPDSIIGKHSIG